MKATSDMDLLAAYGERGSEDAFRELVDRHVDFVYSAALRQLGDPHAAREATQAAFLALAGKAGSLPTGTLIGGWLHRAVHFAARNLRRAEARRRHWEEAAAAMQTPDQDDGMEGFREQIQPQVDQAMAGLEDSDRDALVLRYLEQKTVREVAEELGTSEEAAKKRVQRALERLRALLVRQGVPVSVTVLAAGLLRMPVSAAPPGLAEAVIGSLAGLGAVPAAGVAGAMEAAGTAAATTSAPAGAGAVSAPFLGKAIAVVVVLIIAGAGLLLRSRQGGGDAAAGAGAQAGSNLNMNIRISSVFVDDQEASLRFYTDVVGLVRKRDMPAGLFRWLTLSAARGRTDLELLLEPNAHPDARAYQAALRQQGIPMTSLGAVDVRREIERMRALGARIVQEPVAMGESVIAAFLDPSDNRIQLHQRPARAGEEGGGVFIDLVSIFVEDQERALGFYGGVLGMVKKMDFPVGEHRWLTMVGAGDPDGMQLVLEPSVNPAALAYRSAMQRSGIPATSLFVSDLRAVHARLSARGVVFATPPTPMGPTVMAVLDDTCGNRIQLVQE